MIQTGTVKQGQNACKRLVQCHFDLLIVVAFGVSISLNLEEGRSGRIHRFQLDQGKPDSVPCQELCRKSQRSSKCWRPPDCHSVFNFIKSSKRPLDLLLAGCNI
jgi:hypothetical protein